MGYLRNERKLESGCVDLRPYISKTECLTSKQYGLSVGLCSECFNDVSLQARPKTPSYSWEQWALQHHSVSYLPLCPYITAKGLEQLCASGGLLIC